MNEHSEPRRSLDDSCDLSVAPAKKKVSLPVSRNRTIISFGRTLRDRDRILDLRPPLPGHSVVDTPPDRATGSQMLLQFLRKYATGLNVLSLIDSLV